MPGFRPSGWTWLTLVVLVLASLVLGRRVASRTDVHPLPATAWLIAVGAYLAATLPPQATGGGVGGDGCRLLSHPLSPGIDLGDPHQLLNALIMVPIGLIAVTVVARSAIRVGGVLVGVSLPPGVEGVQAILPMSRTCDAVDVIDGWIGLAIGVALGVAVVAVDRAVVARFR